MAEHIVIANNNSLELGKIVARKLKSDFCALEEKSFPDGELYIRIRNKVKGKTAVFIMSMQPHPNTELLSTIFAVNTAKRLGAKKTIVIAPYLAFMRQDKEFHSGESVSAFIMGRLMECADKLIAIDPHLHRIKKLSTICRNAKSISVNEILAEYIGKHHKNALIIGPDEESHQWAEEIAKKIKKHAVMLRKKRYTSYSVRIKLKENIDFRGKDVVIIDDIISTGHTMIEPIRQLKKRKVKNIYCIGIHGVFANNALKMLKKLGAKVITTNTIQNETSKIDVSGAIIKALR